MCQRQPAMLSCALGGGRNGCGNRHRLDRFRDVGGSGLLVSWSVHLLGAFVGLVLGPIGVTLCYLMAPDL